MIHIAMLFKRQIMEDLQPLAKKKYEITSLGMLNFVEKKNRSQTCHKTKVIQNDDDDDDVDECILPLRKDCKNCSRLKLKICGGN